MVRNIYGLGMALGAAVLVLLVLVGCGTSQVRGQVSPTPEPTPATGIITGTAQVERIELIVRESFPVQVDVQATGYLGDGCTTRDEIMQERTGNTITVTITTRRPADAVCTQQLVGFSESIPVDVDGLPAGTYTVAVNGITDTFRLDVDNRLP